MKLISKVRWLSCKMAHSKYRFALEEAKKTQVENENEKKRKLINEEIMQVKHRGMEVLGCINLLNNDFEKCCTEAEERHNLSPFLKGNAMRRL